MAGPKQGVSANRNSVSLRADGTHVWFLDDDAVASHRCLKELVKCLKQRRDPHKTIISGTVEEWGRRIEPREQNFLGFQAKPYGPTDQQTTVVLGNVIFPRQLFSAIQFDYTLKWVYEEVDFTTRAVTLGYEIVNCQRAVAQHEPPQSTRGRDRYGGEMDIARLYVTGKRRAFTEKHPGRAMIYLVVATTHLLASQIKRRGIRTIPETLSNVGKVIARLYQYGRSQREQVG
jgi:GT2 family glycosyltransferase